MGQETPEIYLSSGGYHDQSGDMVTQSFLDEGIAWVELSGGQYSPNQLSKLKKMLGKGVRYQVHNYFPPPSQPFVFNLASADQDIVEKSIAHVKTAVQWAQELEASLYGFHAGFLFDPKPEELGKRIKNRVMLDRQESLNRFIERVNQLSDWAEKKGVQLLIENNVLSAANFEEFTGNPFLLTGPEEAVFIMENTPDNVNLLIDVAHLKVSAQTLSFDPLQMFEQADLWIRAYHLSDNDGLADLNQPVRENSWFWPYLNRDVWYYSLEVYNVTTKVLQEQYQLTHNKLLSKVSRTNLDGVK
jgi:sugar phosphate isomerase/epimerase